MLLDANMPDLDGFQVAEEIATAPRARRHRRSCCSPHPAIREHARNAGRSEYRRVADQADQATDLLDAILPRGRHRGRALPPPVAAAGSVADRAAVQPVRILLAEDNLVNQTRRARPPRRSAATMVTVMNNGLRGHRRARARGTFDIVLMDVQMPEMGGFEATAAIRAGERDTGGHVRIVAMTAHAMNGDRERCRPPAWTGMCPSRSTSAISSRLSKTAGGRRLQPRRFSKFHRISLAFQRRPTGNPCKSWWFPAHGILRPRYLLGHCGTVRYSYATVTQIYFQKGFGLAAEVGPDLVRSYQSPVVERLKRLGYEASAGDVRVKLAREFGFCYGVDRAVEYAYEARASVPRSPHLPVRRNHP